MGGSRARTGAGGRGTMGRKGGRGREEKVTMSISYGDKDKLIVPFTFNLTFVCVFFVCDIFVCLFVISDPTL